jgi:hypothetical protein
MFSFKVLTSWGRARIANEGIRVLKKIYRPKSKMSVSAMNLD